LILLS
jgi:cysteinyl-tRNA synthetase